MSITIDTVDGLDGLGDHAEWNELVARSPGGSFFQSAQWCAAWWAELTGRPPLTVIRARRGAELAGGAALAVVRVPLLRGSAPAVTAVTNAGTGLGAADHGGFPVLDGDDGVTDALWERVRVLHPARPLLLAHVDPRTPAIDRMRAECVQTSEEPCPVAVIEEGTSFDDVTATWTKNRRKAIRKRTRAFEEQGGRFEWIDASDAVVDTLPRVFALHTARREAIGRSTAFGTGDSSRAFHQRLAASDDPMVGCWIQLALLEGAVVGALYGFRFATTYSVYQSGWDPAFEHLSPGLVQYATAYRHVVERGGTRFDMCRGLDHYKLRFATDTPSDATFVAARGFSGRLLTWRLRIAARRARTGAETPVEDAA